MMIKAIALSKDKNRIGWGRLVVDGWWKGDSFE